MNDLERIAEARDERPQIIHRRSVVTSHKRGLGAGGLLIVVLICIGAVAAVHFYKDALPEETILPAVGLLSWIVIILILYWVIRDAVRAAIRDR